MTLRLSPSRLRLFSLGTLLGHYLSFSRRRIPNFFGRITETLHQWVFSDDFDTSMGSELHDFLVRVAIDDPQFRQTPSVKAMTHKLEHLSSTWGDPVFNTVRPSFLSSLRYSRGSVV